VSREAASVRGTRHVTDLATTGKRSVEWAPAGHHVRTGDKVVGTDVIHAEAERAGATITETQGSHVIMVSQPGTVADVIMTAAATVHRPAAADGA
jgi:hypothetical protein